MEPHITQAARLASIPGARSADGRADTPAIPSPWLPARTDGEARMTVMVVEQVAGLAAHAAAWQDLADHAVERNAFFEPWLLLPAIPRLDPPQRPLFVLVHETRAQGGPLLCGFFPFELVTRFHGLPVRMLRTWKHLHCFLCVPLIRTGHAGAVLEAVIDWARTGAGVDAVDLPFMSADGALQRHLVECTAQSGRLACVTAAFTRAIWRRTGDDVAGYLEGALSGGVRKEYRRQRRRLQELGRLEYRSMPAQGGAGWLERFLALESSGWKAREGTAIAQHEQQRRFVEEAVASGRAAGRALLHGLFLDDAPIAMLMSFRSGAGLFMFKIAYDEAYAKFSPGVQLTLDVLAELHADPAIGWLDSCAMPEHPMINRLLVDRRILQSLIVSTGTRRGDLLVSAWPLARCLSRFARGVRPARPAAGSASLETSA